MANGDPIAQLNRELLSDGRPSLAWVMRWSVDVADALVAAWLVSGDPIAMLDTWRLVGRPALELDVSMHPLRTALDVAAASLPLVRGTRGTAHRNEVRRAIAATWSRLWTETGRAHLVSLAHAIDRWPIAREPFADALRVAGPPVGLDVLVARGVAVKP